MDQELTKMHLTRVTITLGTHLFWGLNIVKLQVLGLRLGVDFTFTLDNNNDNNNNNPHLNFFKGTVLGVKEQGLGIRDKG